MCDESLIASENSRTTCRQVKIERDRLTSSQRRFDLGLVVSAHGRGVVGEELKGICPDELLAGQIIGVEYIDDAGRVESDLQAVIA